MAKPSKPAAKAKPAVKQPAGKIAAKAPAKPLVKVAAKSSVKGPTAAEKNRFTLYGSAGSGPTYTAALMLSVCRHPFSYFHISMRDGAHKQPDYLVKNRYQQQELFYKVCAVFRRSTRQERGSRHANLE